MNDKWPHHWTMGPNLEYIKKNGKKKWLKAQKKDWSCKSCGAEIKWYQRMCSCGQQLDAWDLPA
jgi:anaerobic ribonucleoside-triphosphate reductase